MRIGQGFDQHERSAGDKLVLAGVVVVSEYGLLGHADGDVVLHALINALFGAAAMGDMARHFAESDPAFANADSRTFLRLTQARLTALGYKLGNADLSLYLGSPDVTGYLGAMENNIAEDLQTAPANINIKCLPRPARAGFSETFVSASAVVLLDNV